MRSRLAACSSKEKKHRELQAWELRQSRNEPKVAPWLRNTTKTLGAEFAPLKDRTDCWAGTGDPSAETLCAGGRLLTSFFLSLFPGHLSFSQFRRLISPVCYNKYWFVLLLFNLLEGVHSIRRLIWVHYRVLANPWICCLLRISNPSPLLADSREDCKWLSVGGKKLGRSWRKGGKHRREA